MIERDRHAQYLSALAIVAASLERVATEIRHLQRTEVREVEEPFGGEQRGSSAMPHKRNPVSSEQICGLARVVRANSLAAYENIALWHERDISHSSVERVILPDSTILVDYMLHRTTEIVANMKVFPERMLRNLNATQGLVFSGQLLQDLVEHGAPREDAYKWVQAHAMAAWESETSFKDRIAADANVRKFLDEKALAHTFDLQRQLQAVDAIFARVFGAKSSSRGKPLRCHSEVPTLFSRARNLSSCAALANRSSEERSLTPQTARGFGMTTKRRGRKQIPHR